MKLLQETAGSYDYGCTVSDDTKSICLRCSIRCTSIHVDEGPWDTRIGVLRGDLDLIGLLESQGFVQILSYSHTQVHKQTTSLVEGKEILSRALDTIDEFFSSIQQQLEYQKKIRYAEKSKHYFLTYKEKADMWEKRHKDFIEKNPIAESVLLVPLTKKAVQLKKEQQVTRSYSFTDGTYNLPQYTACIKDEAGLINITLKLQPTSNYWEIRRKDLTYTLTVDSPILDVEQPLAPLGFKPAAWFNWIPWELSVKTYEEGKQKVQQVFDALTSYLEEIQDQLVYKQRSDWASARERDTSKWQEHANLLKKYQVGDADRYQHWADDSASKYFKYTEKHPFAESALTYPELRIGAKKIPKAQVDTPLVDGMTDPYASDPEEWPGQALAAPIGYPHPGFNADNSDKKASVLCYLCSTTLQSGSSEHRTLKGEVCNNHSILEISMDLTRQSWTKRADFTPTFDGGYMDSPGKGLGQANTGDSIFPSNTWMPKGETDQSVNEDIQIGYPGSIQAKAPTTFEQQIEHTLGKEYLEAFILLKSALSQGEPKETCVQTILSNSDYVLDESILSKLADQYLRSSDDFQKEKTLK